MPDRVSNPGPLTYESGALPIALRGPAREGGELGWMTCGFTSFSTVFLPYQDDGWMIMKGGVQWNPDYSREDFA